MPVERVARQRRWVSHLPLLVALLVALGPVPLYGDQTKRTDPNLLRVPATSIGSDLPTAARQLPDAHVIARQVPGPGGGTTIGHPGHRLRLRVPEGRWTAVHPDAGRQASVRGPANHGRSPPGQA